MLAVAATFFSRTAIAQSYNIGAATTSASASRTSSPSPNAAASPPVAFTPSFNVGLWRVQSASHKTTNKRVSVWTCDKRSTEIEKLNPATRERTLEVLKAEASALGKLRHPCILEMVEPLEETRGELIFATEPLLSSLDLSIPDSPRRSPLVELDEIEIQKGILQLCKGLSFLHTSARLIHSNICPESIVINSVGDWKITGLGLTIPLVGPDGKPSQWEFPTFDGRVPAHIQRSFDYMAPEYALDEVLQTGSDMYSLGCVIYAVHCKGNPPFKLHGSLAGLREHAGRPPLNMERLDIDLQGLLGSLITRRADPRPPPSTLPSHPFFNSLPISTLNFLDRSNFTSKSREEKISFMKGLTGVLDRFTEGLRTRKILPSLLEEMKDTHLLPYILPNVFAISTDLSSAQFASIVLPQLRPLFSIKEPPQNMLTLLDNLNMLQEKTDKTVFREQVLPLVYNALESEHAVVQERALKAIPDLCETIDYAEVQGILFPRVAFVFTRTRVLSVKVATLITFLAMVKTLDQISLTQKLVPLLSKIRTKEPAVMMATLAVQEAMGSKVDREAVATLVLPQLWAMSIGPLLNVEQFQRFMTVIRKLSDRVEREHDQFLRDSQRIEDRSATAVDGSAGTTVLSSTVTFEALVGGANGVTVKADATGDGSSKGWEDDVWGSIFAPQQTSGSQSPTQAQTTFASLPRAAQFDSSVRQSKLGAKRISPTSLQPGPSSGMQPVLPTTQARPHQANYSISLPPAVPSSKPPPLQTPSAPNYEAGRFTSTLAPAAPSFAAPPTMSAVLAPSKPPPPKWGSADSKGLTKDDPSWGDFDPLA